MDCRDLPPLVSSFIDAFVDFSVSGFFLPIQNPIPSTATPTHYPSPARLIAIGDLHGDFPKAKQALALAGLVDPATDRWTGGTSVAVQVGDVLDRGGDEIKLLYLIHRLKSEAAGAGGALLTINGNHEIMNVDLDFRYATPSGLAEFTRWGTWYRIGISMKNHCDGVPNPRNPFEGIPRVFPGIRKDCWEGIRARIAALRPNGPISDRFLSLNQTIVVVGDSVFVHGGLLNNHVNYGLEKINDEVRDWIRGLKGRRSPATVRGRDSVVWLRRFSDGLKCDCAHLERILAMIPGARRMVMGHTIQEEGINAVCENRAIRIDVGLSKGCVDGLPEVLEINGGEELRVLTSNEVYRRRRRRPVPEEGGGGGKKGLGLMVPDNKQVEVKA